ncbi:hypothetical protein KC660_02915 [Candidatus Dojkabacteria bacterium]|uniref:ATP-grasp domain-containing protein n=1 Tax=Candidatus Dojkabacteria bacterium TaxID=2099670 RepID=A0A955RI75_9BACT|nr:hypothetical protein [Candidatus Dojkabacteria bacterium]
MIKQVIKNRKKVLGMNERNISFVRPNNPKHAKQVADDKLLTKKILHKADIPTPKLLGKIETKDELRKFDFDSLPKSFVVKPVSGLEGGGIEIFYNRNTNGDWIRSDKSKASIDYLKNHIENILDGRYSIGNIPDKVFFEERVKNHRAFRYYTYKGIPDVRVIVYNGVPIMSYLRLPTKESDGKANMAIGAIGAGIDMATGVTTYGVQGKSSGGRGFYIENIPGTNLKVSGLKVPYWNKILESSILAQQATGLMFGGFDFLIDRELGPLLVEMNARPGLSIQLSNKDGVRWRLKKVEGLKVKSVGKGLRIAKDLFGGEIEEEVESITGKHIIGLNEKVILYSKKGNPVEVNVKIDTGADSTSIDEGLARELGYSEAIDIFNTYKKEHNVPDFIETKSEGLEYEEKLEADLMDKHPDIVEINPIKSSHGRTLRMYIPIEMNIADYRFQTKATVFDRQELQYKMIIGRKSLSNFLVDPSKVSTSLSSKRSSR